MSVITRGFNDNYEEVIVNPTDPPNIPIASGDSIKGFVRDNYTQVARQKYSAKGDGDFYLYAYRDPCLFLVRGLAIFLDEDPASNRSLVHGEDYFISTRDSMYSSSTFANEDVGSTIRILNPDYFEIDLYITYYWVADYVSAEMFNRFDRGIDQMTNSILTDLSGQIVIDNNGNVVVQGERYPGYREEL